MVISADRALGNAHLDESARITDFLQELKQKGFEYIRFEMPDLHGVSRMKLIPVDRVESYARKGLNIYAGTIALDTNSSVVPGSGYHEEVRYCDFMMRPDFDTLTPIPWLEKTAKVICDTYWNSGEPVKGSSRYVAKAMLERAAQLGFDVMMGHEFEFYFLTANTKEPLFDGRHIYNHLRGQFIPEIQQLLNHLRASEIDIITHNSEYAPSQFEINYGPAIGIRGADKAFTFKNAVKEIVHQMGYHATFMTKPFSDRSGSCCHFHISLLDRETKHNAFFDPNDENGLSITLKSFVEGVLVHSPGIMPFINPTPNCYRRLKPRTFAPSNISWGIEDRGAMIRVKATRDEGTHIEVRAASGISNPYLTLASILAAGLLGVKNNLQLRPSGEVTGEDNPNLPKLPFNLDSALNALEADAEIQNMLGEEFVHLFKTVKRFELKRFHSRVSEWEREEYMDVY
ncbi:MAG: Glutamine synthetase [Chroococcidiopsis cubana SAG 39.79]|uniref:glutamine synthetase n=1 Tax=Chroococcidiopsis cubana SAG 39.79 TaxID=388085 RepID=A0AB37UE91_9CYAN|nr:glutamine synthetase family protein [Chroococcidiopsis cubana]MDZ4872260.1 Glutamine synthetase [Chroococcidiopsis cubana SAG 39.79]PSB60947.1 glutamine synthetase [Chroococcidiopsis cubana CCALA 043]RUT07405.1 glutamine synthetase [Chroococcidiopsis cubana SAG 39.79]